MLDREELAGVDAGECVQLLVGEFVRDAAGATLFLPDPREPTVVANKDDSSLAALRGLLGGNFCIVAKGTLGVRVSEVVRDDVSEWYSRVDWEERSDCIESNS